MGNIRDKLTNELLYLFNTGKLYHAYRTFGAHIEDGGVQFTLWAPDVRSVRVTGDFNGWATNAKQLTDEKGDGSYVARTLVPAGRHEYKFVVNGEWLLDPANDNRACNERGDWNNVIIVE